MTFLPYLHFDRDNRRVRLDPHEPAFVQDPYPAYRFFHEHCRHFFWGDFGFTCFAGFDDVNRLLRDRRLGREKPAGAPDSQGVASDRTHLADFDRAEAHSLLELEPPTHTRLRTLVNRAFVSRQVEKLRPRGRQLAHALIDGFEAKGEIDLLPAFAAPLPITIIAEMLGVPADTGPQLVSWSNRMVAMYMHGRTRGTEHDANAAARDFALFLREHLTAKRNQTADDLLSLLLEHHGGEKLTEDELISSTILLLNAGHEATVHQTGNAVHTILAQGGDPRRFFRDTKIAEATVEECLRFDAPLHMFTRYAYDTTEVADGVVLQRGDQIGLLLGAANHDPEAFTEPNNFNPARKDQKNVSFGAGIHFCIGAPLARLEMQEALSVLFERLPNIALTDPPLYRDSYHFHGLRQLLCNW